MTSRPLRLVTRIGLTASLPAVLLGLSVANSYAGTDDPAPAPEPSRSHPPVDPPDPDGTVAWEKTGCAPKYPTVHLYKQVNEPVTLYAATENDTAVAPGDYQDFAGFKVTIPAGSLSAEIPVTIVADGIPEPEEQFKVRVTWPNGDLVGYWIVKIEDGEQPQPCPKK